MSNYSDIAAGLVTVLQNNVTGLKAYDHPRDTINEFPTAVVLPLVLDPEIAFGGDSFEGTLRVIVLVHSDDSAEAYRRIYEHLDPTETNKSVIAAVRADPTLNGKADSSRVAIIESIGRKELWGGNYTGFDMIVEFVKTA